MAAWVPAVAAVFIGTFIAITWAINQRSWVWMRWLHPRRAPLVVVPRPALTDGDGEKTTPYLPNSFWALDLVSPRGPATSYCLPRWVLLIWRLMAIAFWIGSFFQYESTGNLGGWYMTYFTLWTFTLFSATYLLGVAVVIVDMREFPATIRGPTSSFKGAIMNEQGPSAPSEMQQAETTPMPPPPSPPSAEAPAQWTWLRTAHQCSFECVAPASIFLAIFFWATIYNGDSTEFPIGDQLFVHTLSNVFILFDVLFSRVSFISTHLLILLLYSATYLVFMWIYGGVTGDWPYSSLTFEPSAIGYYIALPFLVTVAFCFYLGMAALREWVVRRCGCLRSPSVKGGDVENSAVQLRETHQPPIHTSAV